MEFVWLNGSWVSREMAMIPIDDRGFLFGDGIFTTIKVEQGRIFFLSEHLERLKQQCSLLNITPAVIDPLLVYELVSKNKATTGLWRIKILLSAASSPALNIAARGVGTFLMTISPTIAPTAPLSLGVFSQPIERPLSGIKSLAYLDRLFVRQQAQEAGWDDAIVTCSKGYYLETAFSNIFWIDNRVLYTPDHSLPLLRGVFLAQVERCAKGLGYKINYVRWSRKEAGEIPLFCCNSITGIIAVRSVEGKSLPMDQKNLECLRAAIVQ